MNNRILVLKNSKRVFPEKVKNPFLLLFNKLPEDSYIKKNGLLK